jgi:hypothetical protein
MTKLRLGVISALAALGAATAGAAAAQNVTNETYVDGLRWQINRAADDGVITNYQRRQLMYEQQDARRLAWSCNHTGRYCGRVSRDVQDIQNAIGQNGYSYNRGYRSYDRDDGWRY